MFFCLMQVMHSTNFQTDKQAQKLKTVIAITTMLIYGHYKSQSASASTPSGMLEQSFACIAVG